MKYLTALFAVLSVSALSPAHAAQPINGIAAKVNGKAITMQEVKFHTDPIVGQLAMKYPRRGEQFLKAAMEARAEVLEQLIENKLVLSELEELGASLPDAAIDEEINRIVREVFNGKEEAFREYLQKNGMTRRAFRESQREKILVQVFRQQQFKEVPPATDSEIRSHFDERRNDLRDRSQDRITFRKIFIPALDPDNPVATPDEQLALAEKLAADIKDGADFAETAMAHSDGAFAEDGGLWEGDDGKGVPRPDLEIGFADIVFDTPEGQIVGPLKDPAGFTIVKVLKITHGPAPAFDKKMKERMRAEVEIEKRSARYDEWIQLLKRSAMIKRNI